CKFWHHRSLKRVQNAPYPKICRIDVDRGTLHNSTKRSVLVDLFTFQLMDQMLVTNSFDRLLVVYMPISYFKAVERFVIVEITVAVLLMLVLEIFTVIAARSGGVMVTPTACM
ncbi:unnamed protein product, partial [Anisakis simplex]|uniref:Ion_trans domain-containing protein n=1 Tax=Anisakis simplex TaxID=6269 RepID=A0A0M3IZ54_ANISI